MSRSGARVDEIPERIPLVLPDSTKRLDFVMQEYTAIRREIDTCLANQVSILSFGTATIGLLVAAAGTLWDQEPLLSSLLLLFVVPTAGFLALVIHAGELVRLMRAGYFLHELENWANAAWSSAFEDGRPVLVWEQWRIRRGRADVDRSNSIAITVAFVAMALGFVFTGFWRLHEPPPEQPVDEHVAVWLLVASLVLGLSTILWLYRLRRYAYDYRTAYRTGGTGTPGSRGPVGTSVRACESPPSR